MAPGASIGAAEPIPNDPKHVSALARRVRLDRRAQPPRPHARRRDGRQERRRAGIQEIRRDPLADARTKRCARDVADAIAPTIRAALAGAGVHGDARAAKRTPGARMLARFATSPEVSGLLLSIGMLGLLIEMQTLHGIAGAIGVSALGAVLRHARLRGLRERAGRRARAGRRPGHPLRAARGARARGGRDGRRRSRSGGAIVLAFGSAFIFVAVAIARDRDRALGAGVLVARRGCSRRARSCGASRSPASQGADYVASGDHRALVGRTGVATSFLRPAGVAQRRRPARRRADGGRLRPRRLADSRDARRRCAHLRRPVSRRGRGRGFSRIRGRSSSRSSSVSFCSCTTFRSGCGSARSRRACRSR